MGRIKIFSDSTCDLPPQLIERHQIGIVPLYVSFGEKAYRDGVDLHTDQLYAEVRAKGELPKTSAPSPGDFIEAFAPFIEQGDDILYIGISSHLSSTCQNALIAAGEFPEGRVTVFDSLNLSTGIGLQVMKAVHAAEAGRSVAEIERMLQDVRGKVETEFVIDTLEFLYKGGRCSGLQNLIGSLLKIRPVIKVSDGKMTPASKIRGKRDKALQQLLDNALVRKEEMDGDIIFVTHSMAGEDAEALRQTLIEKTGAREVLVSDAGCVISSHCGPQTIGILFTKK